MTRTDRNFHRQLILLLKELHLPMFREYYAPLANRAVQETMSYSRYLYELVWKECEVRRANKIERLIKTSRLPLEKTLRTFDLKRLPLKLRQQVQILLET
jgi:DNA replication protein DnaC